MPSLASAILRAEIEAALADRIPSALSPAPRLIRQVEPTGIRSVDELLQGGFPVAAITEIVGPECSGRTSLAFSFVSGITHADKVCAWIDVSNAFYPESAAAAGIDLRRLFWVCCGTTLPCKSEPSSKNTFTLSRKYFIPRPIKQGLHGGGFGPHPRGEMNGISNALTNLLRSEPDDLQPVLREKTKSVRPHNDRPEAPQFKQIKLAGRFTKPWLKLDQALRVTDLLLQNGGFAAIVLDMGGIAPEHALRVPLATWFRFRVVAEQKQTSVVLLMQHPCAKSSAALTLRLLPGNPLQEQSTVFTGVEHYIQVERQRFSPSFETVVSSRKPPQQQKYSKWQSRTAWTGR